MTKSCLRVLALATLYPALLAPASEAQEVRSVTPAPPRAEGEGPWKRLILRGATLVDGTGAPPVGPVDIVVMGNRIQSIRSVGAPGVPIDESKRPKAETGDHEIDLQGHYVLPGFVDLHGHLGGSEQGTPAEYVLKLWMAHGITTSADPGSGNGLEFNVEHRKKSEANQITAPRLKAYVTFGQGVKEPIITPEQARAFVQESAKRGADGFKFFGLRPELMAAAIDEAKKLGLRTTCHHAQLAVARLNVLDTARMGLTSMQHWYGLPEAMFLDRSVHDARVLQNEFEVPVLGEIPRIHA